MTELFLIRHGQTDWNTEQRLQGQVDRTLNAFGRAQAAELRTAIDGMRFDAALCSDLQRARETAALLNLARVVVSPMWREIDIGRWSGQLVEDVRRRDGQAYCAWRAGLGDPPGGEGWTALDHRVRTALASVAAMRMPRVAVVTHSGFIKAAIRILGTGEHDAARFFDNLSITTATLDMMPPASECSLHMSQGSPWQTLHRLPTL